MTRLDITPARRITLAFWLTLVAATGLYGLVTLAPGWLTLGDLAELESQNRAAQTRLEERIEYLEQVRDTLRSEPGYATELARLDLQDAVPGENRLKVDESLRLAPVQGLSARRSDSPYGWAMRPAVAALAGNEMLKTTLLVIAAALVLFAFSVLQASQAERLASWGNRLRRR